jgi:hypothetical protein
MRRVVQTATSIVLATLVVVAWQSAASAATAIEYGLIAAL